MVILELRDVKQLSITDTTVEAVLATGHIVSYQYAQPKPSRAKPSTSAARASDPSPRQTPTLDPRPNSPDRDTPDPGFGGLQP